jgi:hypothetical protein
MKVGLLTQEQKNLLEGVVYSPSGYFNPIQDGLNRWVISKEEIDSCNSSNLSWLKELELVDYVKNIPSSGDTSHFDFIGNRV